MFLKFRSGGLYTLPLVVVLFISSASFGQVIYVDDSATGTNDGSTWCDGFVFLQDALDAARASGGSITEIRVAQGTYKPDQGASVTSGDRHAAFQLMSSLSIRGGYAGCGAFDPDDRDINSNQSVLSGSIGDEFTDEDNSRRVLDSMNVSSTTVLEGLTITGAYAWPAPFDVGGGLLNKGGQLRIFKCTFYDNFAVRYGGAITNLDGGRLLINDTVFRSNRASASGGAIYTDGGSLSVTRCKFIRNISGLMGGGVFAEHAQLAFDECVFASNSAIQAGGGAIWSLFSDLRLTDCGFNSNTGQFYGAILQRGGPFRAIDCTFARNEADSHGGALTVSSGPGSLIRCVFTGNTAGSSGGAVLLLTEAPFALDGCIFRQNSSNFNGGGLSIRTGDLTISRCLFSQNTSPSGGGAHISFADIVILDSTFVENGSALGAGLHLAGNSAGTIANSRFFGNHGSPPPPPSPFITHGAALAVTSQQLTITNTDFSGNEANDQGGAMLIRAGGDVLLTNSTLVNNVAGKRGGGVYLRSGGRLSVVNSILWDNADSEGTGELSQVFDAPSDVTDNLSISHSCIEGLASVFIGNGNIGVDPALADPTGLDNRPGTMDDDLRLTTTSPCIDAGENSGVSMDYADLDMDGDVVEQLPLDADWNLRFRDADASLDTGSGVSPIVDIGSYEYAAPCASDFDCDDGSHCNGTELCLDNGECVRSMQLDCNNNLRADDCDIAVLEGGDCYQNGQWDQCLIENCNGEAVCGDCDLNSEPDGCQYDSDIDGVIDECDDCPGSQIEEMLLVDACKTGVQNITLAAC